MRLILFLTIYSFLLLKNAEGVTIVGIVGGDYAEAGEVPFMISLRYKNFHICGASLISEIWVLTAAHCTLKQNKTAYSVQYGLLNITTDKNIIRVVEIIKHELFSMKDTQYDIALIKLEKPVNFSKTCSASILPKPGEIIKAGTIITIAGWGLFSIGGPLSKQLRKVNLPVVDLNECIKNYESTQYKIYNSNICAGTSEGGKGQCNADSGGPMFLDKTLIGIISWSEKPCGIPGYPGVFTRVSSYIEWIHNNIN